MRKLFFSALYIFMIFLASNVFAVGAISPYADRVSISPGESKTIKLEFMFLAEAPQTVSFTPEPIALDSNGNLVIGNKIDELKMKVTSGVSFVQKINPIKTDSKGKWEYVNVTISVPKDTLPGDYPVGIMARPLNLISFLVVDVKGKNSPPEGILKNVKIEVINNKIQLHSEFENKSSRTFLPIIGCYVKKDGKEDYGSMEFDISNPMYEFILPNNSRLFSAVLQRGLPVGTYDFEFFWRVGGRTVKAATRKLNVDQKLYLDQKALFSIDISLTSLHLMLPGNCFFNGNLLIKNLTSQKIVVSFIPTDSWLRVSMPSVEIAPDQMGSVRFAIETPPSFEKLNSKILIIPNVGSAFDFSVKVTPYK